MRFSSLSFRNRCDLGVALAYELASGIFSTGSCRGLDT